MLRLQPAFVPARRRLLRGAAAIGAIALAPIAAPCAAADLTTLEASAAQALLGVCRTLFPHDFLGDAPYLECVRRLDRDLAADPALRATIEAGLAALPADFAGLAQAEREARLRSLRDTPFFARMRTVASALYRDPRVWPHFDYPGPSAPFGGYVGQDLVHLDWLPGSAT